MLSIPRKYKRYVDETVSIIENFVSEHRESYEWSLKDFILDKKELGTGQFGTVYLATEKRTKMRFALKVLTKCELVRRDLQEQAVTEIAVHSGLEHPNIVQFYTYFHDHDNIYIVMEFVPGRDLFTALQQQEKNKFSEHLCAKYVYQVSDALEYCHKKKIIHRDVKPENLMLTSEGDVKLIDFGWSTFLTSKKPTEICGTLDYLAPEIIQQLPYSYKVDNWCLGVLCYELLVGYPPFLTRNQKKTYTKIVDVIVSYPPDIKPAARHLISNLLQKKDAKRFSLEEVKKHPWIVKYVGKEDV